MALHKRVKQGGSYYRGYELIVSSSVGDYVLDMAETSSATINSVQVTPSEYGAGDYWTLSHLNSATTNTITTLANNIYNQGANVSTMFDFPALEPMSPDEVLRLTYTNTATEAVNVYVTVEYVGILK